MTVEISIVPKDSIALIWDDIAPWVKNALGEDISYTVDDVRKACKQNLELWLVHNGNRLTGFLTAQIYDAPQCKCAYGSWLGGENLAEWVGDAFKQFSDYLRKQGVKQYSFIGRKAWSRFLKVDSEQACYFVRL